MDKTDSTDIMPSIIKFQGPALKYSKPKELLKINFCFRKIHREVLNKLKQEFKVVSMSLS